MNNDAVSSSYRPLEKSLREYARGVVGGLIFSLPLLYTMEVWWAGFTSHPGRVVVYVCTTFLLLLGYNRYAGLRSDASWGEVVIDSFEEMGIGLIVSAIILWLLGRVTFDMSLNEALGKIIVEAMAVAVGVSVGTAQLGSDDSEDQEDTGMDGESSQGGEINFTAQVTIALCGAVLFAMNIAPTEEVTQIAVEMRPWNILLLALVSVGIGLSVLYYINFTGSKRFVGSGGIATVLAETVVMYAIALCASALMLWFFGQLDDLALATCIAKTIVLGVVSTLGASAGRLLLQT